MLAVRAGFRRRRSRCTPAPCRPSFVKTRARFSLSGTRADCCRRWSLAFDGFGPLEEGVYDVAFAPSMGRSYHLLAAACCDNTVRIWKLTPKAAEAGSDAGARFEVSEMLQGAAEGERARRVAWNVTGTTLASSSDDGTVRLWRGTTTAHALPVPGHRRPVACLRCSTELLAMRGPRRPHLPPVLPLHAACAPLACTRRVSAGNLYDSWECDHVISGHA